VGNKTRVRKKKERKGEKVGVEAAVERETDIDGSNG